MFARVSRGACSQLARTGGVQAGAGATWNVREGLARAQGRHDWSGSVREEMIIEGLRRQGACRSLEHVTQARCVLETEASSGFGARKCAGGEDLQVLEVVKPEHSLEHLTQTQANFKSQVIRH